MNIPKKAMDVFFMTRDFIKIMTGTDYFHQPDRLGNFFADGRSYYIDFRNKVRWHGDYVDDLPALYFPSLNKSILFPGMVLQYGLGSIDSYFETGDHDLLSKILNIYRWLVKHLQSACYLDNLFRELHGTVEYYSNNSAMTQGEVLSFLTRVVKHRLVMEDVDKIEDIINRVNTNLLLPLEKGGGALYRHDDLYLCEYCRKDEQVVLNGWIFAIFGLYDYHQFSGNGASVLEKTLVTLEKSIGEFLLPHDKWSYYDNKKRLSSPPYQFTHINQLDALYRLTGRQAFHAAACQLRTGYNWRNKIKYSILKIMNKLKDRIPYSTIR